jgi:hypothetical protein
MSRRLVAPVLLALGCLLAMGVAAPVAGALTRDAQMRQNIRLLKIYVDAYAGEHGFVFPAAAIVKKGGGLTAPVWPANPWTGKPMAPGGARGTYTYAATARGAGYTLTAHLAGGAFSVKGGAPTWLANERDAAAAGLQEARSATAAAEANAVAAQEARDHALAEADAAKQSRDAALTEAASARQARDAALTDAATARQARDEALAEAVTAKQARDTALAEAAAARQARDAALADAAAARLARDAALTEAAAARQARDAALADAATAKQARDEALAQLATVQGELAAAHDDLAEAQAALAPSQRRAAELGARLIKGYVEQWGMLNNATAPSADKVTKAGAVGQAFPYWPDNPYTDAPMTMGGEQGDFLYTAGDDGTYTMSVNEGAATWVALDGAVPHQLTTALTAARDEYVKVSMYYLQGAIDRYAWAYSDVFPPQPDVNEADLSPWAFEYWPKNPWFASNMGPSDAMTPGASKGTYTYAVGGQHGYTLAGHLSDGTDYTVDGYWAEQKMGFRDRLKNMVLQAQGQTLKEYVEEWKASHAGVPPTLDQMTKAGAVGGAHTWWPLSPWTNAPMTNSDSLGQYQYAVGPENTYTLSVRQQPISDYQPYFAEYYTPE